MESVSSWIVRQYRPAAHRAGVLMPRLFALVGKLNDPRAAIRGNARTPRAGEDRHVLGRR